MTQAWQAMASAVAGGVLGAVALAAAGCEQAPWGAKPKGQTVGQAAPTPLDQPQIPEHELVARVNQTALSAADVELATSEIRQSWELRQLVEDGNQPWQALPAEERPDALDLTDILANLVEAELKAQDARARGLDAKLPFKRRLAYLQRSLYAQEWDRWQLERATPTEEAIHQFYEQNKAGFVEPERIRARQLVTETLAQAEAARAQAVAGAVFAQLAREQSVGAGKEQGGDIGWHLRALDLERLRLMSGQTPAESVFFPQLEPVAFALEVGEVSQPLKGPDSRYYVLLLEERKPSRQLTELETHDLIKDALTLQQIQQRLRELETPAKIERFPERLSQVKQ